MKKIKFIIVFVLLLMLCSCNNITSYDSNKIRVSIVDSIFYDASNKTELIDYNSNFETIIQMRDGYFIESCNYEDYTLDKVEDNKYLITFKNIKKPIRIKINSFRKDGFNTKNESFNTTIKYNFNDGSNRYEIKNYELSYHIRQNTWNANTLKRDGYTLNGWNTKSDLSGLHIGLGSRVDVSKNETLELYAEWVKWSDVNSFFYEKNSDNTISLKGYVGKGIDDYICIPEYINEYRVTTISNTFTTNIPCGKIKSSTLIIPNTIEYIYDYAFINSSFSNVYFSDNLDFQSYKCFNYNIKHYFINAYQEPRLQKSNYNVRFADNIDLLIKYQNQNKIVLYGGCNFTYGIYSPMIEKEFSNYKVINCGINGEFNSLFQMEIIEKYLSDGDFFIHSPEQMNGYQFMNKLLIDSRMFAMVEGNYDLLSIADFSYSPFVIEAYQDYNKLRLENDICSYEDYSGLFNTYGDYLEDRHYFEVSEESRDISYTEGWKYDLNVLKEENISILGQKYNDMSSKGVTVYFTHSPMNENSCEEDVIYEKAKEFQDRLYEVLEPYNVTIISEITDYIFKGRYFFDTDYHLNFYGAEIRTKKLIEDLIKVGVNK